MSTESAVTFCEIISDLNFWLAFASPVIMVVAIQATRFVRIINNEKEDPNAFSYFRRPIFYFAMLAACCMSALLIGLYIESGVKLNPVLTLNLCFTSNFTIKKTVEGFGRFSGQNNRVDE